MRGEALVLQQRLIYAGAVVCLAFVLISIPSLAGDETAVQLAFLDSKQGKVDAYTAAQSAWRDAVDNQPFCFGDQLRTWAKSRARIHLKNETFVSLDQNTTVSFTNADVQGPSWVDLLRGMVHFISRVPNTFKVRTPYINATIEGTEFSVLVTDAGARIDVFEGKVLAENTYGKVHVLPHQSAWAAAGSAPVLKMQVDPDDAVQWTLYYPPVFDFSAASYAASPAKSAIESVLRDYHAGRLDRALNTLNDVPASQREYKVLQLEAGLLLAVGRVDDAMAQLHEILAHRPDDSGALSLQAVIAVVNNQKEKARELAQRAVAADPKSAIALRARSYVQQAYFKLEDALADAERASELAPDDANSWARVAELKLSLADRDGAEAAADKAAALQPENSLVRTVQGFSLLARYKRDEAIASFRKAIATDSADPLPRLGLGLAKINAGDLDAGVEDLSIATSLDPRNSLLRSYLGKAYYEQKRGKIAEKQFDLAKELDPKDPTPYFYGAIKKQTENRPVEALADMQKAIELNGNRAVYRSKLLVDSDLASRSAAVGRIYHDQGYELVGLAQAWTSLASDPADYSSHRFLADNYSTLPRHEVARVSELLQSQLLQPLNQTPIQPRLGLYNVLLLTQLGPAAPAFNEYNSLFNRDRLSFQLNALAGARGTFGEEAVHSGIWRNWSYSIGQLHYETEGYRKNNDMQVDLVNGFLQTMLSPNLSGQIEVRHKFIEYGDLNEWADGYVNSIYRKRLDENQFRAGLNYKISEGHNIIGYYSHLDGVAFDSNSDNAKSAPQHGDGGEIQYLGKLSDFQIVAGGGVFMSGFEAPKAEGSDTSAHYERITEHGNGYFYGHALFPSSVKWTLGLSYDHVNSDDVYTQKIRQLNPKVGVLWKLGERTVLRMAAFRTLKRNLQGNQTIEPTHVAGFNQLYDDYTSTDARRYGLAIDHTFNDRLFGGFELSARDLFVPHFSISAVEHWHERLGRAYLAWSATPQISVRLLYSFEDFKNDDLNLKDGQGVADTRTHLGSLSFKYAHPSGLGASIETVALGQRAKYPEILGGASLVNGFAIVNLGLSYRFPKRLGILSVDIKNIFDDQFNYQSVGERTAGYSQVPMYTPGRAFYITFNLAL